MADKLKVAGLRLVIDGAAEFNSTITQVNNNLKLSQAQFSKLQAEYGKNSNAVGLLAGKQKLLQDKLQAAQDIGKQYNRILEETVKKYGENSEEADRVRIAIAKNEAEQVKLEKQLEAVSKQLKIQSSEWTQIGQKCEAAGKKLHDAGEKISKVGKSLTTKVTVPLAGLGTAAAKAAIDFETAFAGVAKTVDATDEELAQISNEIRQMAKEIPATTTEIAGVAEAAGQLGIATEDIMSFTRVMIDLGNATNLTADEAAVALAKFVNITGMAASDYDRLGSTIVALGNNFTTTENDIVAMSTRLAAAGTLAGLTETEILALAAAMSSVGIEAEAGGTAMNQTLNAIEKAVATGSDKLQEFARIAGMSASDFAKTWKDKPIEALSSFIKGLGELDKKGESATLVLDELGLSGMRQSNMLKSLSLASGILTDAIEMSSDAWEENTALAAETSKRYETMASKIQVLKNTLSDVAITLGDILIPHIQKAVEKIKEWADRFGQLDKKQQALIIKIGAFVAALGPVLSIGGKIVRGIGTAVTGFGKLATAIGKVSAGGTALSAAFTVMAGPIGGIVAGISAAAAVLGVLYVFFEKNDTVKQHAKYIDGLTKSYGELKTAQEENIKSGIAEVDHLAALKHELDTIVDANGRVKDGYKSRADFILNELNSALGTEMRQIDGVISGYNELTGAIDQMLTKKRAEVVLAAEEEAYTAAIQNLAEYEEAYLSSLDALKNAEAIYTEYHSSDQKKRVEIARQAVEDSGQLLNQALEDRARYESDFELMLNGEYEAITEQHGLITKSEQELSAMTRSELEARAKDLESYCADQQALYEQTGDAIYKERSNEAARELALITQHLASMLSKMVAHGVDMTNAATKAGKDTYNALDVEASKFNSVGAAIASGVASGITANTGSIRSAAIAAAQSAITAMKAALDSHSPSKVFMRIGADVDEGFAIGIRTNMDKVVDATETMSSRIISSIAPTGVNVLSSLAGGIARANASMSAATARNGSKSAYSTINNTYGGITVENLVVRDERDIKAIAQELYKLQVKDARGRAVLA